MATATTTMALPSPAQVKGSAGPDIERQRDDAQRQADQSIDRDAASAVEETRRALDLIAQGKTDEAMAAIERATGKLDVLTARDPSTALLPVAAVVEIVDTAPEDIRAIRDLGAAAEAGAVGGDYPFARLILGMLISEIRIRIHHLPLATYGQALREAAHLLDEKHTDDARALLQATLNSLVVIDRIIPLPLIVAQLAIDLAERDRESDRERASQLLDVARHELDRADELGYTVDFEGDYKALSRAISDVQRQLKGNENTGSAFSKLKEKLASLFRRTSDRSRDSRQQPQASPQQGQRSSASGEAARPQQASSGSTATRPQA